jgi:hypothetical protein
MPELTLNTMNTTILPPDAFTSTQQIHLFLMTAVAATADLAITLQAGKGRRKAGRPSRWFVFRGDSLLGSFTAATRDAAIEAANQRLPRWLAQLGPCPACAGDLSGATNPCALCMDTAAYAAAWDRRTAQIALVAFALAPENDIAANISRGDSATGDRPDDRAARP